MFRCYVSIQRPFVSELPRADATLEGFGHVMTIDKVTAQVVLAIDTLATEGAHVRKDGRGRGLGILWTHHQSTAINNW